MELSGPRRPPGRLTISKEFTPREDTDTDELVDLLADVFDDLLAEAMRTPEFRTAICNIVAAAKRDSPRAAPPKTTAVTRRRAGR